MGVIPFMKEIMPHDGGLSYDVHRPPMMVATDRWQKKIRGFSLARNRSVAKTSAEFRLGPS